MSKELAHVPDTLPIQQVPFSQLERMASAIAKSGLFAVKTPEAALTLLLIAQAEGIPPTQAMMDYQVIQGTPSLKSAAMLARFQRSGGGSNGCSRVMNASRGNSRTPLAAHWWCAGIAPGVRRQGLRAKTCMSNILSR